jgi:hypothetical protein
MSASDGELSPLVWFCITITGQPLELFKAIASDAHCAVKRLATLAGQTAEVYGLVV